MSPKKPLMQTICSACGRRGMPGKPRCVWCGADFHEQPALPEPDRNCPSCHNVLLQQYQDGEWIVQACPRCGGMWLTTWMMQKLEAYYSEVPASRQQRGAAARGVRATVHTEIADPDFRYRHCPQCDHQMSRQRYRKVSGVVVDICMSHGVWFDANEFEHVIEFLESGGLQHSKAFKDCQSAGASFRKIRSTIHPFIRFGL